MVDSQLVWARDSRNGYIKGRITELLNAQEFEVQPLEKKAPKRQCLLDEIFAAIESDDVDHDDNCELMFLNEATLLDNIRNRYSKDKIYCFVANILIATNPYKEIKGLYDDSMINKYQNRSIGEMPPHIYAIADKAVRDMKVFKQSQSIIVSGESGTGKTESTKYILKFLCKSAKIGAIEQKILDANPILEAFGNSKTTRNNNSSRFGKFIEVHYDQKWQVVGGHISHYLLEKSRIISQNEAERNYHVFYMLCAGASNDIRDKLQLHNPDQFRYLNKGSNQYFLNAKTEKLVSASQKSKTHLSQGFLHDPLLDDYNEFQELDQALMRLNIGDDLKFQIYSLVASVLHLGNIQFEDNPEDTRGGCRVKAESEQGLAFTSKLIGVDSFELRTALTSRIMQSKGGGVKGTVIMVS